MKDSKILLKKILTSFYSSDVGVITDAITNNKLKTNITTIEELPRWECWETSDSGLQTYYVFKPNGETAGYVRKDGTLVIRFKRKHIDQCSVVGWDACQILRFVYLKTRIQNKRLKV